MLFILILFPNNDSKAVSVYVGFLSLCSLASENLWESASRFLVKYAAFCFPRKDTKTFYVVLL